MPIHSAFVLRNMRGIANEDYFSLSENLYTAGFTMSAMLAQAGFLVPGLLPGSAWGVHEAVCGRTGATSTHPREHHCTGPEVRAVEPPHLVPGWEEELLALPSFPSGHHLNLSFGTSWSLTKHTGRNEWASSSSFIPIFGLLKFLLGRIGSLVQTPSVDTMFHSLHQGTEATVIYEMFYVVINTIHA